MLVLSRKPGERIVIGDNIVVTIVKAEGNQIRVGVEAPADVSVFREEIAPSKPKSKSKAPRADSPSAPARRPRPLKTPRTGSGAAPDSGYLSIPA